MLILVASLYMQDDQIPLIDLVRKRQNKNKISSDDDSSFKPTINFQSHGYKKFEKKLRSRFENNEIKMHFCVESYTKVWDHSVAENGYKFSSFISLHLDSIFGKII